MSEIKVGDAVISQGTVTEVRAGDGMFRFTLPNGMGTWVYMQDYQLVEPEPLRVGVKVETGGVFGTIDETTSLYRVVADDGNVLGTFRASWLKLIPPESKPEPEYHVVRENDELRLHKIHDNPKGLAITQVAMSNPERVEAAIVRWASDILYGIDADAARKLAAERHIIGRHKLDDSSFAVAIRHGSGWYVKISGVKNAAFHGTSQPQTIGEGIFPKINGLYQD